ncbi:hypothetical protein [Methylobacterium sp. sgz302541]|uniref:hypothetical protein n=1 Tax=unclassified Methylobacterium TaxID=2615210 RepID=UPI003D34E16C
MTPSEALRLAAGLTLVAALSAPAGAEEIDNGILAIGVSGRHGGAIDSLRVLGQETVDTADLGRHIQAVHFFPFAELPAGAPRCDGPKPPWAAPQDAGDQCAGTSEIVALESSGRRHLGVNVRPREWATGETFPGLRYETRIALGPLPYLDAREVAELRYRVRWDASAAGRPPPQAMHAVGAGNGATPVPFIPAAYFGSRTLTRLYGLSLDGAAWQEVAPTVSPDGNYAPSNYRFRAMAWMRPDLGWGVGFYSRRTLDQHCHGVAFPMALPAQAGQCPNFAAQAFPNHGTNNVSVVDQTSGAPDRTREVEELISHVFVGNLATIQANVNTVHGSGH